MESLQRYPWPGNVRELENVIERAVILHSGDTIKLEDLPDDVTGAEPEFDVEQIVPPDMPLPKALEQIEEKLIRRALAQCNDVKSHAAKMLGITKSLIQHKIKKYNIAV